MTFRTYGKCDARASGAATRCVGTPACRLIASESNERVPAQPTGLTPHSVTLGAAAKMTVGGWHGSAVHPKLLKGSVERGDAYEPEQHPLGRS